MIEQRPLPATAGEPFSLARVFALLAIFSLTTLIIVIAIGRNPLASTIAIATLGGLTSVFAGLAFALSRSPTSRLLWPCLVLATVLATGPAYFFGPNSSFATAAVILLIFLGLLSTDPKHRPTVVTVMFCYLLLVGGQAIIVGLVLSKIVPDQSLVAVAIPGHPAWHHVVAHLAVQAGYMVAFLFGRSLRIRYSELSETVADQTREALVQRALVAEAREKYETTLAAARIGMNSHEARNVTNNNTNNQLLNDDGNGRDDRKQSDTTIRLVSVVSTDAPIVSSTTSVPRTDRAPSESVQSPALTQSSSLKSTIAFSEQSLAETIGSGSPLRGEPLKSLVIDICGELKDTHDEGSVHLEVSPRLCRFRSQRWILESGGLGGPPTTGTIAYIAPERFTHAVADQRADVFGLCATIYFAATGTVPFAELDIVDLQRPRPLPQVPNLPQPLRDALLIGLVSDPLKRYQTITDAREALIAAIENRLTAVTSERAKQLDHTGDWHHLPHASPPASEFSVSRNQTTEQLTSVRLWEAAYREKTKVTVAGLTAVCLSGAALFSLIIRNQHALTIAIISFAAMIGAAWLYAFLIRDTKESSPRSNREVRWPWVLIGFFSVGPAFAIGFNSALAGFVALGLFSAGLFQANERASWLAKRGGVALVLCGTTGLVIVLVFAHVIPDISNVAMFQPHASRLEVWILHSWIVISYAVAFMMGRAIDRRYEALSIQAQVATLEAARQSTLLIDTQAELTRLLTAETVGLFSSHHLGEYTTGRLLGRGGMGEVYLARRQNQDEVVALKVLRFDRVADPEHLHLFFSEAHALGRVSSPHVAQILEVGNIDEGLPFIAMEFIDGDALDQRLAHGCSLGIEPTREMVADIGAGLGAVHRANVLHRDIKPANIILTLGDNESHWKLVDFGVASIGIDRESCAPNSSARTIVGTSRYIVGTPRYMSPEQATGQRLNARADLYSFCLVIYRALTGQLAIDGDTPTEIVNAQRTGIVNPTRHTSIPDDVTLALRIGLATNPLDRFSSADELRDAFEDAFAQRLDTQLRMLANDLLKREPWRSKH